MSKDVFSTRYFGKCQRVILISTAIFNKSECKKLFSKCLFHIFLYGGHCSYAGWPKPMVAIIHISPAFIAVKCVCVCVGGGGGGLRKRRCQRYQPHFAFSNLSFWVFEMCVMLLLPFDYDKWNTYSNYVERNIIAADDKWPSEVTCAHVLNIPTIVAWTSVRLQNLPWYKTGLISRQVLHRLSKLQNWIWSKTGQYKTCLVSNTKIEASIRAAKPKPWQSHLTSETVEIFIQNGKTGLVPMQSRFWCGMLSVGTKLVLVQQV